MAPEAIAPIELISSSSSLANSQPVMKIGRASDIWSLGCILYQIIYGKPPFAALNTVQKLCAIPNPNYPISYPRHEDSDAIESIKLCLVRDPKLRAPILGENGLINQSYLQFPKAGVKETKEEQTLGKRSKDELEDANVDGTNYRLSRRSSISDLSSTTSSSRSSSRSILTSSNNSIEEKTSATKTSLKNEGKVAASRLECMNDKENEKENCDRSLSTQQYPSKRIRRAPLTLARTNPTNPVDQPNFRQQVQTSESVADNDAQSALEKRIEELRYSI